MRRKEKVTQYEKTFPHGFEKTMEELITTDTSKEKNFSNL
jgi:hypothetical protein